MEFKLYSNYLYDPLLRSFRPTVRIYAIIILVSKRWIKRTLSRLIDEKRAKKSDLLKASLPPVKFEVFSATSNLSEKTEPLKVKLTDFFDHQAYSIKGGGFPFEINGSRLSVKLSDEVLSAALEYLYRKSTAEFIHFCGKKAAEKYGVLKDNILYSKSRLLEEQTIRAVGMLENMDIKSFTGVGFQVPLIHRNSPLAISIANHLHYNVCKYKGAETIFRLSQQYAVIHQGRSLYRDIADDCIFCKKMRLSYIKQLMGPLSDYQISISPIFYVTYIDAYGPLKGYVPGFSRSTRAGDKSFDLYLVIFCCAATATVNIQVMVGGKDTACFLDVCNRFFAEACVPKICLPDKDGAILKVLTEGEVNLKDLEGTLNREKGIYFKTCSAQDHSAHGRVEARIKMIQDSLNRSSMNKQRLHGLGWQTLSKVIEREINSVPIGYLHHQTDKSTLLQVLTPNSLKLNTCSNRSPVGMFMVPDKAGKLITDVHKVYQSWYEVFVTAYIPLIALRQKWNVESPNLVESDVVYFKLRDSKLSQQWHIGKVEFVQPSRDGKIRTVGISYKHDTEDGDRKLSIVERPVRECIRLLNIEDTSLLEDIAAAQKQAMDILDNEKIVPRGEVKALLDIDEKVKQNESKYVQLNEYRFKPLCNFSALNLSMTNLFQHDPCYQFEDSDALLSYVSLQYEKFKSSGLGLSFVDDRQHVVPYFAHLCEAKTDTSGDLIESEVLKDMNRWTETFTSYEMQLI